MTINIQLKLSSVRYARVTEYIQALLHIIAAFSLSIPANSKIAKDYGETGKRKKGKKKKKKRERLVLLGIVFHSII